MICSRTSIGPGGLKPATRTTPKNTDADRNTEYGHDSFRAFCLNSEPLIDSRRDVSTASATFATFRTCCYSNSGVCGKLQVEGSKTA